MGRSTVYNKGLSENWDNVNEKNKKLLKDFLTYCRASDRSPDSIEQYENNIKIFFCWCIDNADNKFFIDVDKVDIMNYQGFLMHDLNLSPSRVRTLKSAISSCSNYIEKMLDKQYPNFRNIINKAVEAPALECVREKLVLKDDEINELLTKLIELKRYQEACYLALGAYSGSRKSELLRFKVEYFNDEYISNGLYQTPEKLRTKGRGKLGKPLLKWTIVAYFKPYLDLWLKQREELGIDSEYLFVVRDKDNESKYKQAKVQNADYWTEVITKILGKPLYSHSLRHYFVSSLRRANIPDDVIISIMGWAKGSGGAMLDTYDDNSAMEDVGKFFGDNGVIKQEKKETKFS